MRKPPTHKLDILIACHAIPTPYNPATTRMFYLLKYAMRYGHSITLVAHDETEINGKCRDELEKYCNMIEITNKPRNVYVHTLKDALLSPELIRSRTIPAFFYSRKMQKRIRELLLQKKFDVVYCTRQMISYVLNTNVPKVLDLVDPVLYSRFQVYLKETRIPQKILSLLHYYREKITQVPKYKEFDACITVSSFHKELLKPYLPKSVSVIPYGVDLDYFKKITSDEDTPSLVFIGWMSYFHNVKAICYFCNEIYPLIREIIPATRLYIVGREPSKEVAKLGADKSVTVTGFVEDIRPYLSKASVVVVPMVTDDGGIKTKILEAMAMSKPVVVTSIGARGIDVTPGRDIVVADEPKEFADRVVELLNDKPLRRKIGLNARKFMEEEHSCETATDRLIKVFEEVVGGCGNK